MFTCFCTSKVDNDQISFINPLETPQENIIKMVLLGPSGSGKTTLSKQFQKMSACASSISNAEFEDIQNIRSYIKDSIVINMKKICAESLVLSQPFHHKSTIASLQLSLQQSHELTHDIALKIAEIWRDDTIKRILKQRECFQFEDNMEYFLNKVLQIAHADYVPNFEDYVRVKKMSIGFSHTTFKKYIDSFGEYCFDVVDVGGARSERKKWWKCDLLNDPDLNALVFVVPIADYDLLLFEDEATNRLIEALDLFQEIVFKSDDVLKGKSLILLFNKYDVFLEKLQNMPITVCFDDFPRDKMSPNDPDEVMRFIASKFCEILMDNDVDLNSPLRIFKSTALDTNNVEDVFNKMIPHIINRESVNICDYHDIDDSR